VKAGSIVRWPGGSRFITAGGSYLSSSDPRVLIGLGERMELPWIEVDSPGKPARSQRIERPAIDRYLDLR
jgi:hypothetical protein